MIIYHYFPPAMRYVLPGYKWNTSNGKILLTFDDGPSEATPGILSFLADNKLKALFFCSGISAEKYPGLTRQIIDTGHTIGAHGYEHISGWKIPGKRYSRNIIKSAETIEKISGSPVKYYRPPYGGIRPFADKGLTSKGLAPVMWSVLPFDFRNDINIIKFALRKYLKSNSIILLHDKPESTPGTMYALETITDIIHRKGYETGAPGECLK